jgi:hypothetical protein
LLYALRKKYIPQNKLLKDLILFLLLRFMPGFLLYAFTAAVEVSMPPPAKSSPVNRASK